MSKPGDQRAARQPGARQVMLWSEKPEVYEALREELYREFEPSGSSEEYLVQTLLDLRWRRRRLHHYEQITIQNRLAEIREDNQHSRHVDNLRSLASQFSQATSRNKVEALLASLSPLYINTIRQEWPLATGEDEKTWGAKIAKGLSSWKPEPRHEQAQEFMATLDIEAFDIALARIERLDAMIDRTIKRLMQLKTMKQMHARLEPKLINLPPAKDLQQQNGGGSPE